MSVTETKCLSLVSIGDGRPRQQRQTGCELRDLVSVLALRGSSCVTSVMPLNPSKPVASSIKLGKFPLPFPSRAKWEYIWQPFQNCEVPCMLTWVALGPHLARQVLFSDWTPFGVIMFWKADSIKHIKMTNTHGLTRESKLPGPEHEVPPDPTTLPPTPPTLHHIRENSKLSPTRGPCTPPSTHPTLLRNHQVDLAPAALMPHTAVAAIASFQLLWSTPCSPLQGVTHQSLSRCQSPWGKVGAQQM